MALADPEFYVQTMGLKCLTATTKIESIWREVVHRYPHINVSISGSGAADSRNCNKFSIKARFSETQVASCLVERLQSSPDLLE